MGVASFSLWSRLGLSIFSKARFGGLEEGLLSARKGRMFGGLDLYACLFWTMWKVRL